MGNRWGTLLIELPKGFAEDLWENRPPSDMWPTLPPSQLAMLNAIKAALDGHVPAGAVQTLDAVKVWLDSPQTPRERLDGIRHALADPEYAAKIAAVREANRG